LKCLGSRRIPFRRIDFELQCDDIIDYQTLIDLEN